MSKHLSKKQTNKPQSKTSASLMPKERRRLSTIYRLILGSYVPDVSLADYCAILNRLCKF